MSRILRIQLLATSVASLALVLSQTAVAATPQSGPALLEGPAKLAAALSCTSDVDTSDKDPVLLVHGTGATPDEDWGGNLATYLPQNDYPVCEVTIPRRAMTDVQVNVEYVVWAIRSLADRTGKRVDVIGHSQGAWLATYALRFWPDLADKVDDFVGYAGAYTYGTDLANVLCVLPCTEAYRQGKPGSKFLAAMKQKPLPVGPSYTGYWSATDEVLIPQPKASTLVAPGATNFGVQELCPLDVAEHLLIPYERPLLQLTLDALAHTGPANLSRIADLQCGLLPEAAGIVPGLTSFLSGISGAMLQYPSFREPPLRCYLTSTCS